MIGIFIALIILYLGVILFVGTTFVKISLFAMDKLAVFIASWYYTHHYFWLIGKILNLAISFFSSMTVYCILVNGFITNEKSYFLPLLNNDLANQVVNYIIIGIISLVVWKRREDYLIEMDKV